METISTYSDLVTLVDHIRASAVPPTTENIEEQKAELLDLANAVALLFKKEVERSNSRVVALPRYVNDEEWYVVGDLHGDLHSLNRILLKVFIRPKIDPKKIRLIFLGDYVDRGQRPTQVLRLLFRLKKQWPERFYLLRGNHELWRKDENGDVVSDVHPADTIAFWKPHFGDEVFSKLVAAFDAMPIGFVQAVGDRNVLYVHGGIPRRAFLANDLGSAESLNGFLWSDPENKEEVMDAPSRRFSFGAADFRQFVHLHNLHAVVRGHEAKRDGVDLHEEMLGDPQRLITVFSSGGHANEDSGYARSIEEPRFLQLDPILNRHGALFRIEEVFRDDIMLLVRNDHLSAPLIAAAKMMNESQANTMVKTRVLIFDRDAHMRVDGAHDETDSYDNHRLTPTIYVDMREANDTLIDKLRRGRRIEVASYPYLGMKAALKKYPKEDIGEVLIRHYIEAVKSYFPAWGRSQEEALAKLDEYLQRFRK